MAQPCYPLLQLEKGEICTMSDSKEAREEDPSPAEESVGTDQEVQPSLPHEEKQTLSAPAVSSWWRTTSLGDRGVLLDRISELECTVASLHERLVDSEVARSAAKSQLQQAGSQYNDLAAQHKESTARYESRIKVLQVGSVAGPMLGVA